MKKITVSAPGKLLLLGDHAVVYNHPCLVTAVNQRIKVTVERIKTEVLQIEAPDVNINGYQKLMSTLGTGDIPKGAKFVEIAVKNFSTTHSFTGGLKITTFSEFSSEFGFGSSSATTVCVIKALSELFSIQLNEKNIFDIAYKTILDIQQRGSGFDLAAAIYGGTLYFVTGGKEIKKLDIKSLPIIVGYSGVKADTATILKTVAEQNQDLTNTIYNQSEVLVEKAKTDLLAGKFNHVGTAMNMNQELLKKLGVSTTKLDAMITAANNAGAYGAKLSGAGGGDCIIALSSKEKMPDIKEAIKDVGGQILEVETNVEGVRIE